MKRLIVSFDPFIVRAAEVDDRKLRVFVIKRREYLNSLAVGNVYKGIVRNVVPHLGAAFVDIGIGKNAFLCLDKRCVDVINSMGLEVKEGEQIMVQVFKPKVSTKGPKVTVNITLPGNYLVLLRDSDFVGVSKRIENEKKAQKLKDILIRLREEGVGFIARTASVFATENELITEANYLKDINRSISKKFSQAEAPSLLYEEPQLPIKIIREYCDDTIKEIVFDNKEVYEKTKEYLNLTAYRYKDRLRLYKGDKPIFEYFGVGEQIERLQRNVVRLKSGGYIVIEKTEAFFAIDVNSGNYHYYDSEAEEAIFKVNLEAAEEIFNQINLRDLGGLIMVDFIDMKNKEHKKELEDRLEELAKNNKRKTCVSKISEFGVVEISRRKSNTDIFDEMFEKCPVCHNGGLVKSVPIVCSEIYQKIKYSKAKRVRLRAVGAVIEQFKQIDLDKKIEFVQINSCNSEDYDLEVLK